MESKQIRELARFPQTCAACSLGMAYRGGSTAPGSPDQLHPYLDVALEAFGPGLVFTFGIRLAGLLCWRQTYPEVVWNWPSARWSRWRQVGMR